MQVDQRSARSDGESNDRTATAVSRAFDTNPFDRVLVVVDGDATGRAAARTGVQFAAGFGADVDVLYVVDTAEDWDFAVERQERVGERAVEAAAECGARLGVEVEKWFRYGHAHEEVLAFASAHGVDAIVVGSPRSSGLARLLHPDPLTPRLQRRADVPVMVVGPDRG